MTILLTNFQRQVIIEIHSSWAYAEMFVGLLIDADEDGIVKNSPETTLLNKFLTEIVYYSTMRTHERK